MTDLITRDVEYTDGEIRMYGYFCAPQGTDLPAMLLVHDAFGLTEEMKEHAHRVARLGYAVLAADVWGQRHLPESGGDIGPLIGAMVSERPRWMGRIAAAHAALVDQPGVGSGPIAAMGYCFGGSSALEYLRTGGDVRAVVAVHAGLDLLEFDWDSARRDGSVLVLTGADDPMATAEQRASLANALDGAGMDWQIHLYSNTKHAFTSNRPVPPHMSAVVAPNPRATARAWAATKELLHELAGTPTT